jgi:hypothetical protein
MENNFQAGPNISMPFLAGGGMFNNEMHGGHIVSDVTNEMLQNNMRANYGPITFSNGAVYNGELVNGLKDGYGQQIWQDGSKYDG